METRCVYGLEARPLSPEFPVGNNAWGNGDTQLFFVSEDAIGIVGSEDGGGDTSKPPNEVEVVLAGLFTTEETAGGKRIGNGGKDKVSDVGDVAGRTLEETVLGFIGGLVVVDREKTTVGCLLLFIEGLELGSFGGSGDALESGLT
jgi:hypothetical protein